jgi:hypothetical protein
LKYLASPLPLSSQLYQLNPKNFLAGEGSLRERALAPSQNFFPLSNRKIAAYLILRFERGIKEVSIR